MQKILITGCAGFIGSHLCENLLNNGYTVYGLDNFDPYYPKTEKEKNLSGSLSHANFKFFEGDICNIEDLSRLPKDIHLVIHLASKAGVRPSIKNPREYIKNNIIGTQVLLDWMAQNSIKKFVFASSSSIYGNNVKIPFSETDPVDNPISPYAFTKKSCELLNYTYHHLKNIDVINLRFFTVYGPRQRPDLAIRKFVELIKSNKPVIIFGNGYTGRDYTYIDDIVDGICKASTYVLNHNGVYEIINIGNNNPVKLIDLVKLLFDLLNKPEKFEYSAMQEGDVDLTYANIEKAERLLGYKPKISLKEGLTNFINWYESNSK